MTDIIAAPSCTECPAECQIDVTSLDALDGPTHNDNQIIQAAQEAAERLLAGHYWSDWVAIGRALQIGVADAMRTAHTNRPEGRGYAEALHRWLVQHNLEKIAGDRKTRSRLLELLKEIDQVEVWRAALPANKRAEINHPCTVWQHYQKSRPAKSDAASAPNKPQRKSPKQIIVELEEENTRLKANGGNLFTSADTPRDVVRVLKDTFSEHKLAKIRLLL
jgi:hypothetical protein